jgi:hypothetical protein
MFEHLIRYLTELDPIEVGMIFIVMFFGACFGLVRNYPVLNAYFPLVLLASLVLLLGSLALLKIAFNARKTKHFKNLVLLLLLGVGFSTLSLFEMPTYCKSANLQTIWWCLK